MAAGLDIRSAGSTNLIEGTVIECPMIAEVQSMLGDRYYHLTVRASLRARRRISLCGYRVLVRSICFASMSAIEKICGGLFTSWLKQSLEALFRALSVQYQAYVGIHVRPPSLP